MIDIRLASESDLTAIVALHDHYVETSPATFAIYPEPLEQWAESFRRTSGMYPWLVAQDDGAFVGFAKAAPWRPRDAYAYTVEVSAYVAPDHHRRGAGAKLYDRLFAILHGQGYYTAIAAVVIPNAGSERLHAKVGMRAAGTIENAGWKFDRWHSIRLYQLDLQDAQQTPGQISSVASVAG